MMANKILWIQRYSDPLNLGKWKIAFDRSLSRYGGHAFWSMFVKADDIKKLTIFNPFVRDVIYAWTALTNFEKNNSISSFPQQPLWLTSNIKIANKLIFYPEWYN